MEKQVDVAIMGGGLAGLTLALQLRQRFPALDILIVERHKHPVPEATHKVGESSVEIGAHYFESVLGLKPHLETQQLKKFGFRFFFSEGRRNIDQVVELGASRYLTTPSYQLDRGIFENYLAEHAAEQGVRFADGATIREFHLAERASGAAHSLSYEQSGVTYSIRARWLVDASGRAGLIKSKLGLAEQNEHDANSIWFRIADRIDVNEWSRDSAWLTRCEPPDRWLSTNHLCGEGYWVWLIPLASGSHSVGIVADAKLHPLRTMNSFEKAMEWLHQHQPALAAALEGKRDQLQDFAALRRFSYGCKQVFSGDRWAITGEAGVFLDPFYSPGSDFIAIGNTYITELIAKDLACEPVEAFARFYEQFFFSFYRSTLTLYVDQYPMFGDPEVMPVKVIWDYTYYWGVLCQLFFQRRLTDLTMLGRLRKDLLGAMDLNAAMQKFMREWSQSSPRRNGALLLDQAALDWFAELNRGLRDALDDEQFKARIRADVAQLYSLADEIVERAVTEHPGMEASASQVRAITAALPSARSSSSWLTENWYCQLPILSMSRTARTVSSPGKSST
jgi:flavin-dependent dehydrogenase